jgi:hypothetical protein
MEKFVAQRGEFCLLTMQGYAEVMESPHFLPVALAGWAPENDCVVGYIEGETIFRLVDEASWLAALKEYRQSSAACSRTARTPTARRSRKPAWAERPLDPLNAGARTATVVLALLLSPVLVEVSTCAGGDGFWP